VGKKKISTAVTNEDLEKAEEMDRVKKKKGSTKHVYFQAAIEKGIKTKKKGLWERAWC